jgi:adenylate kinase family enzyme
MQRDPGEATRIDKARWQRIHIIGGAGSGKTTLARQLAQRLDVPTYDLDEIAYENGAGAKRPLAMRQADALTIADKPSWITEGGYIWWTEPLIAAADVVIWLDFPWRIAAWRVVKRYVQASLARTNKHRGILKLLRFVLWTRQYYTNESTQPEPDNDIAMSRAATAVMLRPCMGKVVHCRHPATVGKLLRETGRP